MSQETYRMVFRSWFGLTDAEAGALVVLFQNEGRPVSTANLSAALATSDKTLRFMVHRLRQALDAEALDCERGVGYFLTEVGLGECRGALWTIGEELRKAS